MYTLIEDFEDDARSVSGDAFAAGAADVVAPEDDDDNRHSRIRLVVLSVPTDICLRAYISSLATVDDSATSSELSDLIQKLLPSPSRIAL